MSFALASLGMFDEAFRGPRRPCPSVRVPHLHIILEVRHVNYYRVSVYTSHRP